MSGKLIVERNINAGMRGTFVIQHEDGQTFYSQGVKRGDSPWSEGRDVAEFDGIPPGNYIVDWYFGESPNSRSPSKKQLITVMDGKVVKVRM